ncbi:hypothetical protein CEXT_377091 [Caerostris extrusa]|uniref:Uncharacterized protein n=1 Tax=Caerostris extrusa TaxID=172846 RepID=A0AAV4W440_CAEEX|nr:hypothetical protein CEXT_377091 [Caerostris extrusa]
MYTSPSDLSLKLSRDQYPNYSMYHFWKSADNLQEIISDERKNPSSGCCFSFFFNRVPKSKANSPHFALKSPKSFRASDAETPSERLFAGISGAAIVRTYPGVIITTFGGLFLLPISPFFLDFLRFVRRRRKRDSDHLLFWIFLLIRQIVR